MPSFTPSLKYDGLKIQFIIDLCLGRLDQLLPCERGRKQHFKYLCCYYHVDTIIEWVSITAWTPTNLLRAGDLVKWLWEEAHVPKVVGSTFNAAIEV